MRRRSFLKTAAAVIPAAGLHEMLFSFAHAEAPAEKRALHPVPFGEDRSGSAHTTAFSTLLYKVLPSETGGNLFLIEHQHLRAGGPPLHVHLSQEEWFYVIEGRVAFQVGEQRIELKPGESVLAPRMIPHTFAGSETPARMLIGFTPAGKMEQFFRDTNGGIPEHDQAALFARYDMRYIGPSPFKNA
ncbi:MAG TPA: cupin domain-containing protein [Terracidiphilus sp.]|jgi:quercetin dioxygenase-like cupin family protein|nr:cupin domain-containing protein [Terracidiphilus sp.]